MHALLSLIREHQIISRLIDGLERYAEGLVQREWISDASDLQTFACIFRCYVDELHHEKEEEILQPILSRSGFYWSDGVLATVRAEHARERYLVDVLEQAAECELEWTSEDRRSICASALAFVAFEREHLAKENLELFPEVMRRLSREDLDHLKAELDRFDRVPRHAALAVEQLQLADDLLERYAPEPADSQLTPSQERTARGVGSQ